VPPDVPHSVKAITNGKTIVVDYPLRTHGWLPPVAQ
jgi:hypothetical protein